MKVSLRAAIYCLAIGETLNWASMFYSFPALLLRWEADLDWTKPALTGAFTAAVAVSAVLSPIAGRLIDLGRGPVVLTGCTFLGGIALIGLSQTDSFVTFVTCWLLLGIAMAGCLYEPCFILVTRALGKNAQRAITLITLFAGFASTLSFPLGHAVAEAASWRTASLVYAGLTLVAAVPLMWLGSRALQEHHGSAAAIQSAESTPKPHRHAFLKLPQFWLLATAFALLTLNHGVIINHLLPLLKERSVSAETAVLAASMVGPMQVFGRIAMMLVEKHVTVHVFTLACFVSLCIGTAMLIGSASVPVMLVGFVIFQGSAVGVHSILKPMVTRDLLGAENFGSKSGWVTLPVMGGFAFAPYIGSVIWSAGGYALVLKFVFGCAVLGLLCYWATSFVRDRTEEHLQ